MNHATRTSVATIGVCLAIAGSVHGFFEILQGNAPTNGLIIQAIGDSHQMWVHGTEEAFTLIPNFLVTGSLAVLVSLAIFIWSVGFVHTKHGASIFLLLCILLFLVGGGIGQVAFFVPAWLAATRINKPLTWWQKVLTGNARRTLAKVWRVTLTIGVLCFLVGLVISVFGYVPGVADPDTVLSICWTFLLVALGLILFTFASGFAYDIQARQVPES